MSSSNERNWQLFYLPPCDFLSKDALEGRVDGRDGTDLGDVLFELVSVTPVLKKGDIDKDEKASCCWFRKKDSVQAGWAILIMVTVQR